MRWWGPAVDRDDEFAPFLTAHLPVPAALLRRMSLALVLVGFAVALGVVVHHSEQVQLAGVAALEVLVYLPLIDLPTRRLHRHGRVGANFALLHLLSTLALIAWTWLLPLADNGPNANGRGAPVLAGLLGDPHPGSTCGYRAGAWLCGALAIAGGVALHEWIERLGRASASTTDR
ncbi:hypothetical protein [uncultured Jatrophihabitans sp.]|uniref:hypothetical protein n=1 Tax=uncultured Jatrophihabitans sp. TaxID=1610747 RepID=UPI0035CAB4B8